MGAVASLTLVIWSNFAQTKSSDVSILIIGSTNLASENGSNVKLKSFGSDIQVVSLAKRICKHFLCLSQSFPFRCLGVQLTEKTFGTVVLKKNVAIHY